MSLFKCELCPKTYQYERNLKRHVREKHTTIEYWLCVKSDCVSKFVRRSYLSKHLMLKHEFSKLEAHEAACQAPRGDIQCETYYDPVSDDDTIFDLIEEMDQEQYAEQYKETISNFDVTDFNNNEVVPGTSGILNEKESSAMVNVVDIQTVDNSNHVVSCETAYSDITEYNNSDQEVESGDDASNVNAGTVSVADSDEVSEVFAYSVDADDGALNVSDDAVSVIGSSDTSSVLDYFDEEQYNDENNEAEVNDEYEVDNSIVIDSEDEQAVVPSQMQVMTQTIILTLKRRIQYIGDQVVSADISMEQEFYEEYD